MRVVVGKDQSRTPAFSDKMTYIELNPFWNIPDSIAKEEILPKGAAYRMSSATPAVAIVQTMDGPETVKRWSQICTLG